MNMGTMIQAGRAMGAVERSGALQHPALRLATRYWWVSIPTGIAFWSKVQERREKGPLKFHAWFSVASEVLGPIMTIVAFLELADRMEQRKNGNGIASVQQAAPMSGLPVVPTPTFTHDTPPPGRQRA